MGRFNIHSTWQKPFSTHSRGGKSIRLIADLCTQNRWVNAYLHFLDLCFITKFYLQIFVLPPLPTHHHTSSSACPSKLLPGSLQTDFQTEDRVPILYGMRSCPNPQKRFLLFLPLSIFIVYNIIYTTFNQCSWF